MVVTAAVREAAADQHARHQSHTKRKPDFRYLVVTNEKAVIAVSLIRFAVRLDCRLYASPRACVDVDNQEAEEFRVMITVNLRHLQAGSLDRRTYCYGFYLAFIIGEILGLENGSRSLQLSYKIAIFIPDPILTHIQAPNNHSRSSRRTITAVILSRPVDGGSRCRQRIANDLPTAFSASDHISNPLNGCSTR